MNQKMITVAQQVIVLADFSKFGRKSFGKIVDFSQIDIIISNEIPPAFQELFDSLGIETIIAK
jgi:DeoR family transcriptional regulator of aga operon